MHSNYMKRTLARAVCAALALAAANAAEAQQADTVASASLEEVVVTATKRETNLQETPQAISVLNGTQQLERGQTGLKDLSLTVPNVNFAATSNVSQIYIRGIGNTFINAGGDPGVAFYHDNAYVSDHYTTNVAMFDVDRVEVLRGPQGALYGRNAVGGAINVISAKPTEEFAARLGVVGGNKGRLESEGYISGSLGGSSTSARASYQVKQFDGYTDNNFAGGPDTLDDLDSVAVRLQTLTRFEGGGTFGVILSHYDESDNGPALAVKPRPGIVYPTQQLFGIVPTSDPRSTSANFAKNDNKTTTANIELNQPVGDNRLTITGNYRKSERVFLNDCDGTSAVACTYPADTSSDDYFVDAHVASAGDKTFEWLVGAAYTDFSQEQKLDVSWLMPLQYFDPSAPADAAFPIETHTGGTLDTKSYAVYADFKYHLNPVWAIGGQVRYNNTQKDSVQNSVIPAFGTNVVGYTGPGSSLEDSGVPFKLSVEGQLNEQFLVYASYATAEKDGAINIGALQVQPVKKETVKTIEIGEKATLLDERLNLNAAVFSSKYENLQISQIESPNVLLSNVPESTIRGAELELIAMPVHGLQLGLVAGYLDAEFDKFRNSPTLPGLVPGAEQDLSGNTLPYASPVTVNLSANYAFDVGAYAGTVGVQYSWHDRVFFDEFNTDENQQKAVGLLNLSASLTPGGANSWKVYGYVNNLTDETVATGATIYAGPLGAVRAVSYAPPRLFGVGVAYSW